MCLVIFRRFFFNLLQRWYWWDFLQRESRRRNQELKNNVEIKINEVDYVSEEYTKEINVMDYLSEDIWFEIFTHLPLKRIFQLKLISKQWYSLISSSNFCTRKLNLCTFFYKIRFVRLPRIRYQFVPMLFSSNTDSSDYFMSDQAYIRYGFSFNFLLENMQEGLCILGSSNGSLLCRYPLPLWGGDPPYYYFICNPLTRDWIPIPGSIYDDDEHESRALVCESSSSTWNTSPSGFKVVRIPEITVPTKKFYLKISSSSTGCWKNRKVLRSDKITMLYENTKKVVSDQNERLYWIVETNKILVYDLKNNVGGSGECMLIGMPKYEEKDHGSVGDSVLLYHLLPSRKGLSFTLESKIRRWMLVFGC